MLKEDTKLLARAIATGLILLDWRDAPLLTQRQEIKLDCAALEYAIKNDFLPQDKPKEHWRRGRPLK